MAAVLAAGEGSGLSHLSAAVHLNAWRRAVTGIDVIAPDADGPSPACALHTARNLDPRDLTVHRGIPVTTMARTLVDLTDVLTEHQLANVIHEAAFRNRFSERATRAAMARAPGRNLGILERALEAHAGGSAGTRSDLEDQFLAQLPTDLPSPLVNAGVRTPARAHRGGSALAHRKARGRGRRPWPRAPTHPTKRRRARPPPEPGRLHGAPRRPRGPGSRMDGEGQAATAAPPRRGSPAPVIAPVARSRSTICTPPKNRFGARNRASVWPAASSPASSSPGSR